MPRPGLPARAVRTSASSPISASPGARIPRAIRVPRSSAGYFNLFRRFHESKHKFGNVFQRHGGGSGHCGFKRSAGQRKHVSHAAGIAASESGSVESDGQYAIRLAIDFVQPARAVNQYRSQHNAGGAGGSDSKSNNGALIMSTADR